MYKVPLSYNEIDHESYGTLLKSYSGRNHEEIVSDFELEASSRLLNYPTVAVSSGTAALHLALSVLGVKRGDMVVVPTFAYVAVINPVLYLGAIPIWIDSEMQTWNLDPELLEKALKKYGRKIKAIIAVHNYGVPAQMEAILKLARKNKIPVIEDAAEAWGATIQGKPCGTLGDIGVFSFNSNKTVTAFGGGLLTIRSAKVAERVRLLASQARLPKPYYEFNEVGYNYRISPLVAGYGLIQLRKASELVDARKLVFEAYCKFFQAASNVNWVSPLKDHEASRWLPAFIFSSSFKLKQLIKTIDNQGIEIRRGWNPLHRMKHLEDFPSFLNGNSELLFKKVACLPCNIDWLENPELKAVIGYVL